MTLRRKILLLGLLAFASICVVLARQYVAYAEQSRQLTDISSSVRVVDALSRATHELQKERGLTTLALAGATDGALPAQIGRTDAVLDELAAASRDFSGVRADIGQLRRAVVSGSLTAIAARDRYTFLLQGLLDEMARITRKPEAAVAREDVAAHAHLVALKEYLGQMRATLGYWIENGEDGQAALLSLIRLKGLFEEERRKFAFTSSPELRQAFDAGLTGREALATLEAVSQAIARCHPALGLGAQTWWAMASTSMDQLHVLEDRSLRHIERQAENRLRQAKDLMVHEGAVTAVAGLAVLLLAASIVYGLLRSINGLLFGMERIAASQDFHLRIPDGQQDEIGRISRRFNQLLDIAEQSMAAKDQLAATDPLTGIHNRLCFAKVLFEEAERKRRNGTPMALILFDIDRFKRINDVHGHDAGDKVLVALTGRVGHEIRTGDFFCRWGGEEFVLLLRDEGCDAALAVAEKIRQIIAATDFPPVGRLTCSFGVALWSDGDSDVSLVKRADEALYYSKHGGRNRVSCELGPAEACTGSATCRRCRQS